MKVSTVDKDGQILQKECAGLNSAKRWISSNWSSLLRFDSSIFSHIQFDEEDEVIMIRVGKNTVQYWNFCRVDELDHYCKEFRPYLERIKAL